MKNNARLIFFILLFLFNKHVVHGQNLQELRRQFPGDKAVMLNKTFEYNISIKDGKPHVESSESQQIEYLSESAAFMSEYGFFHSDFQQVVGYEAYTRTPNEKKFKVSEFKTTTNKASFVFYDDVKETTFNFPAIEAGAIGNLNVSWVNKDPHLLSPFYFSNYLPAINSVLKITCSKDITLKYLLAGIDTSQVDVKIETKHHNNVYTFQYKNCSAERKYADAPGVPWYSPHVIFYIENYKDEKGNTARYLEDPNDLYKLNADFIKTINHAISRELQHIVDSLTTGQLSPEIKARNIYSWVQHQIKYVAFEQGMEGFIPRDANLVCDRRFGDCKDMASILTLMLNSANIPAYFTWIGTRDLPYKFSEIPLPLVSNHMICTIKINDGYIFLDATDPTCVFGFPSYGIQGKEAMVAFNEKEYKILTVPEVEENQNGLVDSTWIEIDNNNIKGKIKKELKGYFAMRMYGTLMYANGKSMNEDMKMEFARGSNKFRLDTFSVAKKETANNILLNGGFTLPDYAKKIGDEYYLNLNLFKFFENEEIDFPRRKIPIGYEFKYVKKYVTLLKIPPGFKVSYLPQGKTYHNEVWGFTMHYEQQGNWVILTQTFDNKTLLLTSDKFQAWNQVLENLFPLYKETLSLSKN